jgi:streptogramin lyase
VDVTSFVVNNTDSPYNGLTSEGGSGFVSAPQIRFYGIGYNNRNFNDSRFWNKTPAATPVMVDDGTGNGTYKLSGITVTDGGDGMYPGRVPYIEVYGGKGTTARARPVIADGQVVAILIPEGQGGSGYSDIANLEVVISGGQGSGATAQIDPENGLSPLVEVPNSGNPPRLSGGAIQQINVINGGTGYSASRPPIVTFVGGKGMGAQGSANMVSDGKITSVSVPTNGGSGYEVETFTYEQWLDDKDLAHVIIPPPWSATPGGNLQGYTDGTDPQAVARISSVDPNGVITGIEILHAGSGYIGQPSVSFNDPPNAGTTASGSSATFEVDGRVINVDLTNMGTKYTEEKPVSFNARAPTEAASPGPAAVARFYLEGNSDGTEYPYRYNPRQSTGAGKFQGAYVSNTGIIYSIPWNSHRILQIQTSGGNAGVVSDIEITGLGDVAIQRSKWKHAVPNPSNATLYLIPYNVKRVAKLDLNNANAELLSRTAGGSPIIFQGQWNSGVLSTATGVIYCFPASSDNLLVIDTKGDNDRLTETVQFDNVKGTGDKWSWSIRSDSGLLYGIPRDIRSVIEINPGVALRAVALPASGVVLSDKNTIVFPPKDGNIAMYDYGNAVVTTVSVPSANVSYADGVVLDNGNVAFTPTYVVTDPFDFDGKAALFDPSSNAFTYSPSIDITEAAPYPSRSTIAFGEKVCWVPRYTTSGVITWETSDAASNEPVVATSSGGAAAARDEESVPWATSIKVSGSKSLHMVQAPTSVREIAIPEMSNTGSGGNSIMEGVVAPDGTIVCIPGWNRDTIQIFWPEYPTTQFPNTTFPRTVIYPPSTMFEFTNGTKFGGGALGSDGRVYCVPRNHKSILAIDVRDDSLEEFGDFIQNYDDITLSTNNTIPELWQGLVVAPNGDMYGIPYNADYVVVIHPAQTNPALKFELIDQKLSDLGLGGTAKFWGGVAAGSKIYCVPYAASVVLIIDTTTNTLDIASITGISGQYRTGVAASNGQIYCAPYNTSNVLKIDPDTNTVSYIDVKNGGGYGGSAIGENGLVYFSPSTQTSVLELDPSTDQFRNLGDFFYSSPSLNIKWTGGLTAATNGRMYAFPAYINTFLEIFPDRKYIGSFDNTDNSWTPGAATQKEFRLRPYTLGEDNVILYHNDDQYALYESNGATQNTQLVLGPDLEDGISTVVDTGEFVSIRNSNVSVMTPFEGGITGVKSFSGNADLSMTVQDSDLLVAVGNGVGRPRFIFDTIYGDGAMGVFGGLAGGGTINTTIRDVELTADPYTWSGDVGANVGVGIVNGTRFDQINVPEYRAQFSGSLSEIVFFTSDQQPKGTTFGESQSFYYLDSRNVDLTSNNSTKTVDRLQ